MEVPGMEDTEPDSHMTSAAAFVEGGIQEACDDACSICLEDFCESDPSTVTNCKHEFHLQCILEWCQRSSQCPMCWQPIGLKDPSSQELLEAVEKERNFRATSSRNAAIFHHHALGDFQLQHLPVGANEADIEERIIQHLAAAASVGRAHHLGRREGHRTRSSAHGRPHFLLFSTHPTSPPSGPASTTREEDELALIHGGSPSTPHSSGGDEPLQQIPQVSSLQTQSSFPAAGSTLMMRNRWRTLSNNRSSASPSSPRSQDRAGPSDLHSFSESLRSKFNAVSMRYKESISKSTRGWKERLFSRNSSMSDIGSEVRREVNAGIASVSRMIERFDTRENTRAGGTFVTNNFGHNSITETSNPSSPEDCRQNPMNNNQTQTSCTASSSSN